MLFTSLLVISQVTLSCVLMCLLCLFGSIRAKYVNNVHLFHRLWDAINNQELKLT